MRSILWVEVIEREIGTDYGVSVTHRYPFPEIGGKFIYIPTIQELKGIISNVSDSITRECNENRLHFILNRWHVNKFVRVVYDNWKYT